MPVGAMPTEQNYPAVVEPQPLPDLFAQSRVDGRHKGAHS